MRGEGKYTVLRDGDFGGFGLSPSVVVPVNGSAVEQATL